MSCKRKGTCGSSPEGSGYTKPRDPVLAAANEKAFADMMNARAQYDSFWGPTPACDPNGSNAQTGWPSESEPYHIMSYEEMMASRDTYDQKWLAAHPESVDPSEFVGIDDDTGVKTITIDRSLDVSGHELTPIYDVCFENIPDADDFIQHEAYWPVEPNPPSSLLVEGPGSSSTTSTSVQTDKSPVAN
jgi:hypothetical protein